MFDLIVSLTAHTQADVDPIVQSLARMRPMCLAEPGCLGWEAYHSEADPTRFVLVEHWESRAHWEHHGQLAAIQTEYLIHVLPRATREAHPSSRLGRG